MAALAADNRYQTMNDASVKLNVIVVSTFFQWATHSQSGQSHRIQVLILAKLPIFPPLVLTKDDDINKSCLYIHSIFVHFHFVFIVASGGIHDHCGWKRKSVNNQKRRNHRTKKKPIIIIKTENKTLGNGSDESGERWRVGMYPIDKRAISSSAVRRNTNCDRIESKRGRANSEKKKKWNRCWCRHLRANNRLHSPGDFLFSSFRTYIDFVSIWFKDLSN